VHKLLIPQSLTESGNDSTRNRALRHAASSRMHLALHLLRLVRAPAANRTRLALENMVLRQQLAVFQRNGYCCLRATTADPE